MKFQSIFALLLVILLSGCTNDEIKQTNTNSSILLDETKKEKMEAIVDLVSVIHHTKAELIGTDQRGNYLIKYNDGEIEHSIMYEALTGEVFENDNRQYNALKVKVFIDLLTAREGNDAIFSGIDEQNKRLIFSFAVAGTEDTTKTLFVDENTGDVYGIKGDLLFNLFEKE